MRLLTMCMLFFVSSFALATPTKLSPCPPPKEGDEITIEQDDGQGSYQQHNITVTDDMFNKLDGKFEQVMNDKLDTVLGFCKDDQCKLPDGLVEGMAFEAVPKDKLKDTMLKACRRGLDLSGTNKANNTAFVNLIIKDLLNDQINASIQRTNIEHEKLWYHIKTEDFKNYSFISGLSFTIVYWVLAILTIIFMCLCCKNRSKSK